MEGTLLSIQILPREGKGPRVWACPLAHLPASWFHLGCPTQGSAWWLLGILQYHSISSNTHLPPSRWWLIPTPMAVFTGLFSLHPAEGSSTKKGLLSLLTALSQRREQGPPSTHMCSSWNQRRLAEPLTPPVVSQDRSINVSYSWREGLTHVGLYYTLWQDCILSVLKKGKASKLHLLGTDCMHTDLSLC